VKRGGDVDRDSDPWDYTLTGPGLKFEKPVQFGVATWSQNMVSGIMGAGYGRGYNQKYSGFIDEIYDQNLVQDKDFAIALGSVSDGEGERSPQPMVLVCIWRSRG